MVSPMRADVPGLGLTIDTSCPRARSPRASSYVLQPLPPQTGGNASVGMRIFNRPPPIACPAAPRLPPRSPYSAPSSCTPAPRAPARRGRVSSVVPDRSTPATRRPLLSLVPTADTGPLRRRPQRAREYDPLAGPRQAVLTPCTRRF